MVRDINSLFHYNRLKSVVYRDVDIVKLKTNRIKSKEDWNSKEFSSLKRYLRYQHYKSQKRRCSYCRRKLSPLGINEHIDHIVARSVKVGWMFKPKNLVLSCFQCNTQKSDQSFLQKGRYFKRLPKKKINYELFNPYFHIWSEHFEIEDNLFIRAKSKEGENTIKRLKLYDHKYSIIYADEANIFDRSGIERATQRLTQFPKGSIEYKSAEKLVEEMKNFI